MSDNFLNARGLGELRTWILGKLGLKQDTLVSGTNIKTINNTSLLGSGNINITSDVTDVTVDGVSVVSSGIAAIDLTGKQDLLSIATDSVAGTIKLNPSESVNVNANGQLDVGGRLGAFPTTTGIFHSKDREPRSVGEYTFLITDSKGMYVSGARDLAIVTGVNLTLNSSHAAGSTSYQVTNNYANRIACYVLKNGGYVALSETQATLAPIIPVTNVTINGSSSWTPDSSANSSTPIIITVEESVNPDTAITQLRVFGAVTGGFCSEYIGQCVGGTTGASLTIGQRVYSTNNVNCVISADTWNSGNGNTVLGRQHISRKNRWLIAGTGHDNTNGISEAGAVLGQWALISSDTAFAIGNGTSQTARSNLFEIKTNGDIYVNGTKVLP